MIDDALPGLLRQASTPWSGQSFSKGGLSFMDRLRILDVFECMIRIDNVASSQCLTGVNQKLDSWALSDPAGLSHRLTKASMSLTLATFLTVSEAGLGRLANHVSLHRWIEAARAVNRVTRAQAESLRQDRSVESYLCGAGGMKRPKLNLPLSSPIPVPSALRVVQNFRFRKDLLSDAGYREAMRRYVRFFC